MAEALTLRLADGKEYTLHLSENTSASEELERFLRGDGQYHGEWIRVGPGVAINRHAVVAVSVTGEFFLH